MYHNLHFSSLPFDLVFVFFSKLSSSTHLPQGILNFFQKYGFVVIQNAISDEAVDKTIDQLWDSQYFGESTAHSFFHC